MSPLLALGLFFLLVLLFCILYLVTLATPAVRRLPSEIPPELLGPSYNYYEVPYVFRKEKGPYGERLEKKLEAKQYDADGNRIYTALN
jgi:hypothetical protein